MDRRGFLAAFPAMCVAVSAVPSHASGPRRFEHPEPRPGIDASGVVSDESLRADGFDEAVIEAFDGIRQIPQIADGLACYCGCMLVGNRSLLTCYYDDGMARGCQICQGEGRLAYRRWKEGQTLEQIRRAIDARFGS